MLLGGSLQEVDPNRAPIAISLPSPRSQYFQPCGDLGSEILTLSRTNTVQSSIDGTVHNIEKILTEIKESQDRQEERLSRLIFGQSQSWNIENGTSGSKDMGNFIERCDSRLGDIWQKLEVCEEKNSQLVQRCMAAVDRLSISTNSVDGHLSTYEEAGTKDARLAATGVNDNHDAGPFTSQAINTAESIDTEASDAKEWALFQETLKSNRQKHTRLYKELMRMTHKKKSVWHHLSDRTGLSSCLATEAPTTFLATIAYHPIFNAISGSLVLINAFLIGKEADSNIKVALQKPGVQELKWISTCDLIFNILFTAEVLFRIIALGSWFFVAPGDWAWNLFDLFVVIWSLVSDLLSGINLSFMRSLRLLRAVRAVRIIRVLRAFRELRKMLLAMLASIKSLLWVFLFLSMLIYMVAILLLQGLAGALEDMQNSEEFVFYKTAIEPWYGSLGQTELSLLRTFTGGAEWYAAFVPLHTAGATYQLVFVLFILFITVGLMNILIGIFMANAGDIADHDLVIQDYRVKVEGFVKMMLELFSELDLNHSGDIDWHTFMRAMESDRVQAYIAANGLSPLQAGVIFDLLDEHRDGRINLFDFVFGMTRLKGNATAVDVKVLMKEIGMIPEIVGSKIWQSKTHAADQTMV